jgi:CTP-dependent riboflavin kinase
MLNDLLNTLDRGKTISLQEIAAKQHRSIETVKAEIEYLEHQGYIKKTVLPSCQGKVVTVVRAALRFFPCRLCGRRHEQVKSCRGGRMKKRKIL